MYCWEMKASAGQRRAHRAAGGAAQLLTVSTAEAVAGQWLRQPLRSSPAEIERVVQEGKACEVSDGVVGALELSGRRMVLSF